MNIVQALKTVKNDLFDLIVDGLNSKAPVDHFHSYNDLADLPIIDGDGGRVEGAVLYTKQTLTDEQKAQTRNNIGITSIGSNFDNCKYVEEFKTDSNSWDAAFADLISYCTTNGCTACATGTYTLTNPLLIGDVNVNFEGSNITNKTTTEACIILTGANRKTHRFGVVIGRVGIGILINTANNKYEYNKLYATEICGYVNALAIATTNHVCYFNEFHVIRLRSSQIPLRVYCETQLTKWANECYFYLGAIETYRADDGFKPIKLIELTNATRCNFYNLDIEQPLANPDTDPAIELTNCCTIGFFNPRIQEPSNAVQFRFIGECYDNFVDAEYCKYATIDCSQMFVSDMHYNVFRGRVVTTNSGNVTNCNTLRVYKDMIIPVTLIKATREVSSDLEINHNLILSSWSDPEDGTGIRNGIPTLYKWTGGNITVNKRFIALLPTTLQIMKISDSVGSILDEDGNIIIDGANMDKDKQYNINVDSYVYNLNTDNASGIKRPYLNNIVLSVDKAVNDYTDEEKEKLANIESLIDDKVWSIVAEMHPSECELTITVAFENDVIPLPDNTNFSVFAKIPSGYTHTLRMSTNVSTLRWRNMDCGRYSLEINTSELQVDGYNLSVRYTMQYENGDPFESQTIKLVTVKPNATCTITLCYEKIE